MTPSRTLFAAVFAVALAGGAIAAHPHLHHALHELKEALVELKEAAHDFGGHRVNALKAVDAAIIQVEKCLKAKDDGYKLKVGKDIYRKYKHHPHIHHAIVELKEARKELKEAPHNFGGHRERAIKDIDFAIKQLELALKFANKK
jgi:hypothetical protein